MIGRLIRHTIIAVPVIAFAVGCGAIGNFPNSADTVTVYTTPPPQPSITVTPEAVPMGPVAAPRLEPAAG